jgi:tetratricopeptide (TPR) repeat protein/transcriptional regulator with XRE-family HTH domain
MSVDAQPVQSFAGLLRRVRGDAGLTQEELAHAAGLSPRSVSDLERGVNRTARRDTARLLADALGLIGTQRALFEAAARGRGSVVHAHRREDGAPAATRTLPRDIASFTGRSAQVAQLTAAVTDAAAADGVVGICAVSGMAGIGKTTFAVHAAHRMTAHFPDGQYFLPLHAHTPGQQPVDPASALANLLLTVGVAAQQIPAGLPARAARWRDHLAGKKVLLLLDDAASHEQVTPLLPGTAGNAVVVTSRRRLTALPDATAISLDTLEPDEAAALLARLAGRPELSSSTGPAAKLTKLCGYLPLAIGLLGRQLHHHPAWTAADLATELTASVNRLDLMAAENLSVAATFDLSYQDLTAAQQRLFRRLGAHPGTDIDPYAAAALDGIDLATARRQLDVLYDNYLLAEPARGRYRLHDLVREHARSLAAVDDAADTDAAVERLLGYYLHTAAAAGRHVPTRNTAVKRPLPADKPAVSPVLATAGHAATWLDTEYANLHAAAVLAAMSGRTDHAIAIPAAISGFLFARGHWDDSVALQRSALAAARQIGDLAGQADALNELGILQRSTGDYRAAAATNHQALALYRDSGDRLGQAGALDELGRLQRETGDYPAAVASHQQALALYRDLGHQAGQARALTNMGNAQARAGDYAAATASHEQALRIFHRIDHRLGQAIATGNLGTVQLRTGDYPAAAASLTRALDIYRDLGDRLGQANAIANLGDVQSLAGDYPAATASLTQALEMHRELGDRGNTAGVLNDLGEVLTKVGDVRHAHDRHTEALAIAREINKPLEQARALEGLGNCMVGSENPDAAAYWREALTLYSQLGAPDAERVREFLRRPGRSTTSTNRTSRRRRRSSPTGGAKG